MKPETIQKLQENVPELKELMAFLATELQKLNTLSDLPEARADREIAVEGKRWAHKTLAAMLAPLIGKVDEIVGVDPAEYVA